MKNYYSILSIFLLSVIGVYSQLNIEFYSGIGVTDIKEVSKPGIINDAYSKGLGFATGVSLNKSVFKEHLFLKSGLNFTEKGAFYPTYFGVNREFKISRRENVYYLEVPLIVQFKFFPLLKIQAGIYNGFRLNMKADDNGIFNDSYVNYHDFYDFGYIGGAQIEYKKFVFEVNLSKSLQSIGQIGVWDENLQRVVKSEDTDFFNQTLIFSFGYKIFSI